MTNSEALQAVVDLSYQIDSLGLQKALLDQSLSATDDYTSANRRGVDIAAADVIWALVSSSDIDEGSFKLTLADRKVLIAKRSAILLQYGLPDSLRPTISSVRVW